MIFLQARSGVIIRSADGKSLANTGFSCYCGRLLQWAVLQFPFMVGFERGKMKKKLTVSEVAKLLDMNPHTIRYYDKEGLITSEQDPINGYRMFDLEDVTKLANIIILRESGIPIKAIKGLVDDYSKDAYQEQLASSLSQLKEKLEKMVLQKKVIENTLRLLADEEPSFAVKSYPDRYLSVVNTSSYEAENSAVELLNGVKQKKLKEIIYKRLVYEFLEEEMMVCFENPVKTDFCLEAGAYLEYLITVHSDDEITQAIERLIRYGLEHQLSMQERLYMSVEPHAMLVVDHGYQAKLFVKIEEG